MTTLNARANQAYHAMVEEAGDNWMGFDHQRDAFEEGWETGYKTADQEWRIPTALEIEAAAHALFADREALREQIAETLLTHYPTTGMAVARGVTCQCGYWNGNESPGSDRPIGAQGRDGLNWHRAQVVLALLAGEQERVESP